MKIKVSKERVVMAIAIGIACFSLMLVMFMQFKVVRQTDITAIETMRESELRLELTNWNEKYKELEEKYQDTTSKIDEYKNERSWLEQIEFFLSSLSKEYLYSATIQKETITVNSKES